MKRANFCCNYDCNEGRACPLRTGNGGEAVDTSKPQTNTAAPISELRALRAEALCWLIGGMGALVVIWLMAANWSRLAALL